MPRAWLQIRTAGLKEGSDFCPMVPHLQCTMEECCGPADVKDSLVSSEVMAASDPCTVRGQWWSAEEGSGTLDDLVTGLARVAFKPPVGLFTEGIPCKGEQVVWVGKQAYCGGKGGWKWRDWEIRSGWGGPGNNREMGREVLSPRPQAFLASLPTRLPDVTVVHPDAVPSYFAVTFHGVVVEVISATSKGGVDDHL